MPEILRAVPDAVYVMVGRSNDYDFFNRVAQESGVSSNVIFYGIASNAEVVDLYNLADLFVLNSRHSADGDFEGFGIAVIEAALCRLPAIVTSDSGLTEAIEDGVTGLTVPPDNAAETARAVISVLNDNTLRESMARAALERANNDYTWDKVGEKYRSELNRIETL